MVENANNCNDKTKLTTRTEGRRDRDAWINDRVCLCPCVCVFVCVCRDRNRCLEMDGRLAGRNGFSTQ